MVKIMLVEDDRSLREIYGVRLLAEGYDIVSAGDGEEALAMAIKERPQLIISDVMMPKISGFDMLDILRSTTETKTIKVIMMTALSSDEQRSRGESLGADRYLVKSQVGIEDVVRVVHEVLGDQQPPATVAPQSTPVAPPQATTPSVQPAAPVPVAAPVTPPVLPVTPAAPVAPQAPVPPAPTLPQPHSSIAPAAPTAPSVRSRVIQPLNDPRVSPVNINDLLNKELAREAGTDAAGAPVVATTAQEKSTVADQLNQFATTLDTSEGADDMAGIPGVAIGPDGSIAAEAPAPAPAPTAMPTPMTPPAPATPAAPAPQA